MEKYQRMRQMLDKHQQINIQNATCLWDKGIQNATCLWDKGLDASECLIQWLQNYKTKGNKEKATICHTFNL